MISHLPETRPTKYFFRIAGAILCLCLSVSVHAATITSTGTGGNWDIGGTWVGGTAPLATDDVVIADGATVTIRTNVSCVNLQVGQGVSGTLLTDNTNRTVGVTGNLVVSAGGLFNLSRAVLTVTGTTTIAGSVTDNNDNGSAVFTGLVTIDAAGSFSTANTSAFTFAGGITNNGTFNKTGTGAVTFNNSQAITSSGVATMAFNGAITVNGLATSITGTTAFSSTGAITLAANVVLTNSNTSTVTITGALNGAATSTWINDVNSSLIYNNAAAPMNTGTLNASANPNTVTYNLNGAQNIKGATYYNIIVANTNTKTLTGAVTVNNNITVNTGITLNLADQNFTNNGTATISGTISDNNNAGTNIFTDLVTINNGGALSTANNSPYTFGGGIANSGTFSKTGTGAVIFNNDQTINSSGTATMTIAGAVTINGLNTILTGTTAATFSGSVTLANDVVVSNTNISTVTITGALNGSNGVSEWVNEANSSLTYNNAAQPMATGLLTAAASPNTVTYNLNAAQAVKGTTYHNLTVSNGNTKTLAGNVTVNNALTLATGTTLQLSTYDLTSSGTTSITGTLNDNSATGTNLFTGAVTINAGGTWTTTNNPSFTFRGGISNAGTMTATGAGTYTFNTNSQTIGGTTAITFGGPVQISGAITITNQNTNTVTINGALNGDDPLSTWRNDNGSTLSYGSTALAFATNGVLDVAATTNTVNYSLNGLQSIYTAGNYYNLTMSAGGTKTLTGNLTVLNNLNIAGGTLDLGTVATTFNVQGNTSVAGTLSYNGTTTKTVNLTGDLSGGGTINMSGGSLLHVLNLNGASNTVVLTTAAVASVVNYVRNGDQTMISSNNYRAVGFSGSGTKTLQANNTIANDITVGTGTIFNLNAKTLTSSGNINVNSGGELDILSSATVSAQLLIGATKTLTNNGVVKLIGQVGFPAIISRTAGTYSIVQNTAGAVFHANIYQINYTNGGVVISDGSIDATNNFSNGSFSNGTGSQYLNLTNLDLTGMPDVSTVVFNAGPTYNITRTAGTGAMNLLNTSGALSGESYDNDNGNPGTLINWAFPSTTYYSKAGSSFNAGDLTMWTSNSDGSGSNPTSVTDGLKTLIIQNGHSVTVEATAGNIDVNQLQVNTGGTLTIGNNASQRIVIVRTNLVVQTGAIIQVGSSGAPTHVLRIYGDISNSGTINLRTTAVNLVDAELYGATGSIYGSAGIMFNNLTFKTGSNVTVSAGMNVIGNLTMETGSTFNDGNQTHNIGGNWSETGTGQRTGSGTINFNGIVNSINAGGTPVIFYNVNFAGGGAGSILEAMQVNGAFHVSNNTSVTSSVNNTETFNGDFTIDAGSTYSHSANNTTFGGTAAQAITNNGTCTFVALNFSNGGGSAKTLTGNITASGLTTVNSGAIIDGAANLTLVGGFFMNGTCNLSGQVNMNGGALYTNSATNSLSLGTAVLNIGGNVSLSYAAPATSCQVNVDNNVNINTGYILAQLNTSFVGQAGHTFTVASGATYYARGTDNFASGFGTYNLNAASWTRYDVNIPQTIRGGVTYGNTEMFGNVKTAEGDVTVAGNLDLNSAVNFNLGNYTLNFSGASILNGTNSSITGAGATINLNAPDAPQVVESSGTGSYSVQNINVTLDAPTATRTKTFNAPSTINLTGDFTVSSAGGALATQLIVNLNTITLGGTPQNLSVGPWCQLYTSHTNFSTGFTDLFTGTKTFNVNSTVYYALNGVQNIADGFIYGNLAMNAGNKTAEGALDINGNISSNGAVFFDGGFTHAIAGNWSLNSACYTAASAAGTIVLDGADQDITTNNNTNIFRNLTISNSGTAILNAATNTAVLGTLTISNGAKLDANTRPVSVGGNWSEAGTGQFIHTTGTVTFNGSANQTITQTAASSFNGVTITNTGAAGSDTVKALTNIRIAGAINISADDGVFSVAGVNAYLGDNLITNLNAANGQTFIATNGTIYFNGDGATSQNIGNRNVNPLVLNNVIFTGSKPKVFGWQNTGSSLVDINGDVDISGATLDGRGWGGWGAVNFNVAGNWNNTGSFLHANTVTFDGAAQNISSSSFYHTVFGGSATKSLLGNITVAGNLTINSGAALDAGSNSINLSGNWTNSAADALFNCGTGTVVFENNGANINTGVTTGLPFPAGKSFYNVTVNKNAGQNANLLSDIYVGNDFAITGGTFVPGAFDMWVTGNFNNSGTYNAGNSAHTLTLNATGGNLTFNPGGATFRGLVVNAPGATYKATSDFGFTGVNFTLTDGSFDLDGRNLTVNNAGQRIVLDGGTFDIDTGRITFTANNQVLQNNNAVLRLMGTSAKPATLTRSGGTFTVIQSGGTLHANEYKIDQGNGFTITGGTIDATNNLSNGTFSGGTAGTSYLTLTGYNFADFSVTDVSFSAGPTNNVSRTSGTGTITFQDASGSLSGESYDQDNGVPGTLINWTYPSGFFWDGEAGTDDWNDPLNWSSNTLPDATSDVTLNHMFVVGAYTVKIKNANGLCRRLTLDAQAGAAIGLTLESGYDLTVQEHVTINATTTISITDNTNIINVWGNWTNNGTFNHGNSTVFFNGPAGTYTINSGGTGAGKHFYNLTINGAGTTYVLAAAADIDNNLTVTNGTFDLAGAAYDILVGGDWNIDNIAGGLFNPRNADVTFDGNNQSIINGPFYNFIASGTGTKTLNSNTDINNNLTIGAGVTVNAQENTVYCAVNWTNNGVFSQTGLGTVNFDGTGNQQIDNGTASTTFNHLVLSNAGNKTLYRNIDVAGDFTINSGSGTVNLQTYTVDGSGANTFTIAGATTMEVRGANNFPDNFAAYVLANTSTVTYRADIDQTIKVTSGWSYGNLILRDETGPATSSKICPAGTLSIAGNLDIANDTRTRLDMNTNSANMTLTGNLNFATGGIQIDWGTGTSTLTHDGAYWNIDPDITGFNNMIFSGTGNKWMRGDLTVSGNVTVKTAVYLRMYPDNNNALPHTMTGAAGKTFTMENGSFLLNATPSATAVAFPTGFSAYSLDPASTVYLYSPAAVNQTLYTGNSIIYGNLYFRNIKNVTSDGVATLDVNGSLDLEYSTYIDNGRNMNVAGADIWFGNYTPSASTVVLNLDGNGNQYIRDNIATDLLFGALTISGTGTKTIGDGNDNITMSGNFSNTSLTAVATTNRPFAFNGSTWNNLGIFTQTGSTLTITNAGAVSINPGPVNAANYFNNVVFDGAGTKTFNTTGSNVNGTFTISAGTVNLGSLTHYIAGTITNTTGGTLTSASADIVLDGGNQNVNTPAFAVNNITIAGTGTKRLFSDWTVNGDLTINTGTILNTSDNVIPTLYNIALKGDWTNNGTFTSNTSKVTFNGGASPVTITAGVSSFYDVDFTPSVATAFNLLSASTRISRTMLLDASSTLNLNSQTLILGSNIGAGKTYTVQGTLNINENASLKFDNQGSIPVMNVTGTLRAIGTNSSNIATISRQVAGTPAANATQINILAGGTIAARYYLIEYLQDGGLVCQAGSTLDATNNFSDGVWSNIRAATGVCYINLESNYAGGVINNITFNYTGTPTVSSQYNVRRNTAVPDITFDNVSGNLGVYTFEDDEEALTSATSGKLRWPGVTLTNWTGAVNTDWHTAGNWDNGVPTATVDAVIPDRANDPRITTGDAVCKSLQITNGSLIIDNNTDLTASGDITIGTAANVGILSVNTSSSVITCGGLWTRGTNGIFIHGSGTVVFNSGSGSATITPLSSSFYNVSFNNAGTTFYLTGATLNILNEFQIVSGTVNPATNNYTYNIGGSFNNQGTFNPITGGVTAGTVILNGASDQQITRGRFYNLTVSGSNIKYTNDTLIVTNTTAVNSTLRANAGSVHDFNGNMTIAAAGTYHDGGGNHTFAGTGWTCAGTYTGTGTITFDRTTAAQVINSGSFYNLVVACTGQIFQVTTNITVNNNLTFKNGIAYASLTGTISNPGSGTFTVENAVNIYVLGTNCFPSGFLTYSLDPTCFTRYQGTSDQTILGVTYGNLVLQNANVKTLSGDIAVLGTLYLNTTGITFDVSPNNYNISLAGNWTAQGGANTTFNCRQGEVLFNGAGTQDITYDATATNNFYDITVNKSAGSVRTTSNVPYTIQNNLTVSSGTFDPWGRTITIGGNLNNVGGTIVTSGTFNLNKASGSAIIRSNGSVFNNLTINSAGGATYTAQDNMSLVNNFNLTAGTFDGNGRTVSLGDWNTDVVNIAGTYKIGAGGRLTLGNGTSLTIGNTGRFEAIGTAGNVAVVSRNASGGSYNFLVNGTIAARYYLFEYMNSAGIFVNNTATIDATNNFSNGTFTNGSNNGIYLRVENTQSFTDPNYITDVAFPVVPAGSSFNVRKISAASGTLEFYNSTGTFAGETNDDDPASLVIWTGPITLTWNGSQNTDWNNALNWTPSTGPAIVPTGAEHVIIAAAVNQPILTTFGAMTSNLTINTGATLTLNTPADASANDLTVNGDVTINGTLRLNTINDYMSVGGSWIKAAAGTVVCNGNVTFNGTSGGAKTINNGVATFYNLTISGTNLYQLGVSTTIRNNIVIDAGASFDVTTAPYNLIIGGSWTNNGTFLAQTGKVTFNTTAGPLNITSGSSSFYDIDINAASQTYRLAGTMSLNHNLNVIAGTLDLNSNILNVGDGNGVDYLTITGILETDGSSSLRMGANSVVQVNSGGTLKLLGSSLSNRAIMTRQSAGNYSVTINSGGNIWARYYNIEYTNTNGVYMMSGSLLNSSNNFSDGTFANGQAGGRYLRFENEFGGDITIANVVFGAGPSYNVTRTSGTDQVIMQDISGAIGTYLNEEDMGGVVDANIGMLLWTYMNTFTWTGNVDTDWHTGGNWSSGIVPNNTKDAIIPNVTNKPVISTGAAEANRITIYTGSSLTVSNQNLTVTQDIFYSGTITATGTPVITIGDNWTSSGGSFSPGNSRVVLNAATGTKTISVGASQFYDLTINTGGTYSLSGNTTIQHNLTINSGTLNSNGFDLYVGGSWSNSGTFTQGTRTITFNGSSGTHSINNGLGSLYNLTITGTATYQLASALTLTNNYTQTNGTFDLSNDGGVTSNNLIIGNRFYSVGGNVFARAATIQVGENFTILGTGSFTCGTSTLRMTSTSGTRSVGPRTSALYNLTLAGTTTFRPANNLDINGTLTINASNTLDMVTPVSYNLNIAGNMTVLGTFLAQNSVVTFDGADQSFTNSSVQTFYRVTLNNTGTLTLASNHIIVSNGLTMTAGRINTGTYKLTLGTSTANIGTLTYTAGTIIGKFERWMNNIGTAYIFPVGTATNNNRITVTCVAGLTSGSLITEFLSGDPGSSGMPLTESSRLINQQFTDGYWNITAANSLACTNYNVTLNGTGFASYTIDAETRVLKRTNDGAWSLEGTHVAAATPNCYRNALNGISTLGTQLGFGRSNCAMPVFTLQPSNSTICAGSNTTFVITATGTTLSYQWQLSTDGGGSWANQADGGVYSGMTTATMTITAALAGMDSYQYRCIITDICLQTATSNVATLTVNSLPAVTVQPLNQTVCVSAVATFTVNATGTGVSYQWQEDQGSGWNNLSNGGVYSNVTTANLNVTGVAIMSGYQYRCVVSGTCTPSATSNAATLTVNLLPFVVSHPTGSAICEGSSTSFNVIGTGTSITYQWQYSSDGGGSWNNVVNGGVYGGATTTTLSITAAPFSMTTYQYRCVISGACTPAATSNTATLTVNIIPVTQPILRIMNSY